MGVNPIIALLSLIAFTSVFGLAGALLALPLAAIIQLLIGRAVSTAAESARQAQNKEAESQSLVDETQAFIQTIYEASNKNPSFRDMPESDRSELFALAEELNQLVDRIKNEGETL